MNVVITDIPILGVSTSQAIVVLLAALTLLALTTLLWMNHRTPVAQVPILVHVQTGVLCPADSVDRPFQTIPVRMPARAPPTFHSQFHANPLEGKQCALPLSRGARWIRH
jgi:hypothetical protein